MTSINENHPTDIANPLAHTRPVKVTSKCQVIDDALVIDSGVTPAESGAHRVRAPPAWKLGGTPTQSPSLPALTKFGIQVLKSSSCTRRCGICSGDRSCAASGCLRLCRASTHRTTGAVHATPWRSPLSLEVLREFISQGSVAAAMLLSRQPCSADPTSRAHTALAPPLCVPTDSVATATVSVAPN